MVKSCPKLSCLFFAFGFRKILTETTEIIKNFDKCQKYTGIFKNRWYLSKIDGQNGQNLTKNGTNLTKNYTEIFNFLPKLVTFRPFDSYQKCTKIFDFRLTTFPVHFPKLLKKPKLLPERMSLIPSLVSLSTKLNMEVVLVSFKADLRK